MEVSDSMDSGKGDRISGPRKKALLSSSIGKSSAKVRRYCESRYVRCLSVALHCQIRRSTTRPLLRWHFRPKLASDIWSMKQWKYLSTVWDGHGNTEGDFRLVDLTETVTEGWIAVWNDEVVHHPSYRFPVHLGIGIDPNFDWDVNTNIWDSEIGNKRRSWRERLVPNAEN